MYIIGLDIGTTGTKAVLVDEGGTVCGGGYKGYELKSDGVRVTQRAADWWDAATFAVKEATKNVKKEEVLALSLSTQAASMAPCDKNGDPIYDVITWMDNRATAEAEYISEKIGAENIYKKSGWLPSPVLDAAKILWLKNNEPEIFASAHMFISTLEYMNIKLCGKAVIDPTNAAMRQMFDLQSGKWDKEILDVIGITEERLPEILPIGEEVGTLTDAAADALGLCKTTKVFNGAHDQYFAAMGCGAVNTGDMLLATGTTWVVLGITDKLLYTKNHISPGIHPVKGQYGALASLVSAGSALNWYTKLFDGDFKALDIEAAKRRESAKDLFVLPYVCGAGFPHMRPDMRGVFYGLDVGHDKVDIYRAVMEGVAFEAASVLQLFRENGMNISTLMMTGGAARSRIWSEIVGYVTGCDIYRMKEPETCCIGAAMTAAVGVGMFRDFAECREVMVKREKLELCDDSAREFYKEKREKYYELVKKIL